LVGDIAAGKSTLLNTYIHRTFPDYLGSTVGAEFSSKVVGDLEIQFWDTAGQERFRCMMPLYYRNANLILLIVDMSSVDSIKHTKTWYNQIRQHTDARIVLVGTKMDIVHDMQTQNMELIKSTASELFFLEKEEGTLVYVSSKDQQSLDVLFDDYVVPILNQIGTKRTSKAVDVKQNTIHRSRRSLFSFCF